MRARVIVFNTTFNYRFLFNKLFQTTYIRKCAHLHITLWVTAKAGRTAAEGYSGNDSLVAKQVEINISRCISLETFGYSGNGSLVAK
jgi:hypothetical protein